MFRNILQFELKYQSKQLAFALLSVLFLVIGLQIGKQGYGRGVSIYNSPQSISEIAGIISLGSVFIIMFFTIHGVLRDSRYHFQPIVFSTPVKKFHYFWSQFLAVFGMSLAAFSMFLVGFAITTLFPGLDPELVNSFQISDYLWTLLIIAIPNIFVCTSIIFSVSLLSKNNVATYASAILIYAFYFLCSLFLNSPIMASSTPVSADSYVMAALLDPFGLSALFEQTQFWTAFEKNTKYIAFAGNFMWNRLLWVGVGSLVLISTYFLFSFRMPESKSKKDKNTIAETTNKTAYKTVTTSSKDQWQTFYSLLKLELRNAMKSLPFIAVILMWIVIIIIEIFSRIVEGGAYNDSLYPATYKMIGMFVDPLLILSYILIVFYSGEIVWRERVLNFNGIIDSTPAKNKSFYFAKLTTLISLPFVLIVMGIIMSMTLQVLFDYHHYDFWMYLSLFYNPGLTFVFYSLMAVFIQSIIPNKYLGMGITGLIIIFLGTSMSSSTGIEHPMLLMGNLPNINFTGMNGFAGVVKSYNYLAIYWLLFAGVLGFFSFQLWQRGIVSKLSFRVNLMRTNWTRKSTYILSLLIVFFFCSASSVYYNLHVAVPYINNSQNLDLRETYERQYSKLKDISGLFPVKMDTKVDLYPSDKRYVVKGTYILKNKSSQVLTKYLITEKEVIKELSLEGGTLIDKNPDLGVYVFEFKNGIQPNEELVFQYTIDKQLKGFEISKNIVENGTYIQQRDFEPRLGYSNSLEISNTIERKKRGLPEKEITEITEDHITNTESSVGRVYFSTVVSTDADQTALSSGELVKQWTENNRNYFEYKFNDLMMPMMGYFSGNYTTKTANYKGTSIEQFYLPENDFNIDRIEESVKKTLDYCTQYFGKYPFQHVRLAQIPSHWQFGAFAHPGTISMTEDRNYLVDLRDSLAFDLVAKRTIHEMAHQWFGHILSPKNVEGASMFVEGFAKYTEAVVMEKMYGKSAIWELSRNANHRYFTYRAYTNDSEPPVYQVSGQGYLSYGKNYTIMLALRDLIGEEKLNTVIKSILDRHKNQVELKATSIEFLNEVYKITSEEYHQLIDDWFKRVITYDLKIDEAKVTKIANNNYQIEIDITSKRFETSTNGSIKEISINEPIQIGVFEKHPKNYRLNEQSILIQNYQINKEESTIVLTVDKAPSYVSIDPYGTRNDENFTDNTFKIK